MERNLREDALTFFQKIGNLSFTKLANLGEGAFMVKQSNDIVCENIGIRVGAVSRELSVNQVQIDGCRGTIQDCG